MPYKKWQSFEPLNKQYNLTMKNVLERNHFINYSVVTQRGLVAFEMSIFNIP